MIYESRYWKDPLLRSAAFLEKSSLIVSDELRSDQYDDLWSECEYHVMHGFFSIRKLIDAETKLTTPLLNCQLTVEKCSAIGNPARHQRWELEDYYDVQNWNKIQKPIYWICSQIIHSFIFWNDFDAEGRATGFFFASDKEKAKACYWISIEKVIQCFKQFGSDYPSSQRRTLELDSSGNTTWKYVLE